eukprot:4042352-Prymnesium_polylepis.1
MGAPSQEATAKRTTGRIRIDVASRAPEQQGVASLLRDPGFEAKERLRELKRELKKQQQQRKLLEAA